MKTHHHPRGFIALLMIAGFLSLSTPVSSDTSTLWTTTADFDAGDKGLFAWPGSWTRKAQYPIETNLCVATFGGYIYAFGGFNGNGVLPGTREDDGFRYNPITDSWSSIAAMPENRSDCATAVWADRIYAFAGANDTSDDIAKVTYYNVTTGTWFPGAGTGVVIGIAGEGQMAATHGSGDFIYLSSGSALYRYNPVDGTYVLRLSPACTTGIGAVNTIIGNYWYFMSGKDDTTRKARRYDINANTCDNAYDDEPFEARRYEGSYESEPVINGKMYLVAGFDGAGGPNAVFYRTTWEWEPIGKVWRQMASAGIERTAWGTSIDGILYVLGGTLDNGACGCAARAVEAMDPNGVTYDGRNQIDSNTDSPRAVVSGEVRIASGITDTFPRSDWVGNPAFWVPTNRFKYGPCEYGIVAGNASLSVLKNYSDTLQGCAITSSYSFNGDFDVRGELTVWGTMTGFNALTVMNTRLLCPWGTQIACGAAPPVSGIYGAMAVLRISTGNLDTYTLTDGQFTSCGATIPSLGLNEYIRIRKIGSQWTFFHGTDGIVWTQATQCTAATNGPWYYSVFESGGTSGTGGAALRDVYLETAAVLDGTHRMSGQWVSPEVPITEERVTRITLNHSSLSDSYYVDSVELLEDGAVAWSYTNNLISGSQTVLSPNQNVDGDVSVRVTLAGAGDASPILESVLLESATITPAAPNDLILWLLGFAFIALLVIGFLTSKILFVPAGIIMIFFLVEAFNRTGQISISFGLGILAISTIILGIAWEDDL